MEYLNKESFQERVFDLKTPEIFKGSKPVIIDFFAEWCGPCKVVAPILESLSKEYEGKIDIYKVDIDQVHELASFFKIRSIPSILFIPSNGGPSKMIHGAVPKKTMEEAIKEVLKA